MNGQERIDERRRRQAGRRGFTLIELLVVILIILLVSAVVLPTVLPAISHRQVSEAARILQGALAGARDTAINNNAPAGIRLLPDPVLNGQSTQRPERYPDDARPDPDPGLQPVHPDPARAGLFGGACQCGHWSPRTAFNARRSQPASYFPYPAQNGGGYYPAGSFVMLYVEQSVYRSHDQPAQLADLLVLEHPDWRQDPAQQHGDLVHRRRPHERSTTPSCSSTLAIPGRRLPS